MRHTRFQGAIVAGDQIVLVRHHSRISDHEYWVIPGGGIEAGESETECVAREMREETGLEVRVERLLLDLRNPQGRYYRRQKTYLCTPLSGTLAAGSEPEAANFEITAIDWFSLSQPGTWWDRLHRRDWVVPALVQVSRELGYHAELPQVDDELYAVPPRSVQSDGYLIREGRDTDAETLAQMLFSGRTGLRHLVADRRGRPLEPARLRADLNSRSTLIAYNENAPAGLIVASEEWDAPSSEMAWTTRGTALTVHLLAVHPPDLATRLLRLVRSQAREWGYGSLRACLPAHAEQGQVDATALLERMGFRCSGFQSGRDGSYLWYERPLRPWETEQEGAREERP